jgi:hypothetical protein
MKLRIQNYAVIIPTENSYIIIIIIIIRGATALTNIGRLSSRRWQSFPTAPDGTGLKFNNKIKLQNYKNYKNYKITEFYAK